MKSTVIAKLGNIKTVGECTEVLRLIVPKYYESDFAKISDELPLYLQRKDVVKKKKRTMEADVYVEHKTDGTAHSEGLGSSKM